MLVSTAVHVTKTVRMLGKLPKAAPKASKPQCGLLKIAHGIGDIWDKSEPTQMAARMDCCSFQMHGNNHNCRLHACGIFPAVVL